MYVEVTYLYICPIRKRHNEYSTKYITKHKEVL